MNVIVNLNANSTIHMNAFRWSQEAEKRADFTHSYFTQDFPMYRRYGSVIVFLVFGLMQITKRKYNQNINKSLGFCQVVSLSVD